MPAKWFVCPHDDHIEIADCLDSCPKGTRCMLLPTLRSVAASLNREILGVSVTELLIGIRETYLKKTIDYAVDPQKKLSALLGSGIHAVHEHHAYGQMRSEERLYGEYCSGKYDLYGTLVDEDGGTLADIKTANAAKISRALGMYKAEVPTGEFFKSGPRKGQPKTKKEWRTGGVRHLLSFAIQINYYRMLLEAQGSSVSKMVIEAICKDSGSRASEYNIDKVVYLIPISKISDRWISCYLGYKAIVLDLALRGRKKPPVCNFRERWGDKKCLDFCEVADFCDYGQKVKAASSARYVRR